MKIFIHKTAEVSEDSVIGNGTKIWNGVQVREKVKIGENCILGKDVYIDVGVSIGDSVKIENMACVYQGSKIDDGVFIGPGVCLANDKFPRATAASGNLKSGGSEQKDWVLGRILVKSGASIGANSTVLPGVTIGSWSMVGAGSVVVKDVPDYGLVYGNPAKMVGYVCKCGYRLSLMKRKIGVSLMKCKKCDESFEIDTEKKVMV